MISVALHAVATNLVVRALIKYAQPSHERFGHRSRPVILGLTAAALALKHFLDIVLWAIAYLFFTGNEQLANFETAVYFSSVTYTTLGYGDIVLTGSWRIMCGIEAMNGILVFGWSTALLFVLVQRIWFADPTALTTGKRSDS